MAPTISFLIYESRATFIFVFFVTVVSSKGFPIFESHEPILADDTIGHYVLRHPPKNYISEVVAQTSNCIALGYNVDVFTLNSPTWSYASSPVFVARRRRLASRIPIFNSYSYTVTYDDGNGNIYNDTYPT
jgi:hypothetical protein